MALSQLALEDVEALCLGSSFQMADPMGPLLDQDEDEAFSPSSSLEVNAPASPSFSPSSYQTLPLSPSPAPSHSSLLGTKVDDDLLTSSLLHVGNLLNAHVGADDDKDDAFEDMEWMSEKLDLSDLDLDSLIDSCSSAESPSSPEDLLASLDSPIGLDLWDTALPVQQSGPALRPPSPDAPLPPKTTAEPKAVLVQEVDVKSEPSPAYTLELGSEVDVLEKASPIPISGIIQATSSILLSIPNAGHFVVVLANKEESHVPLPEQSVAASPSNGCESDSGVDSGVDSSASTPPHQPASPSFGSSRTQPYCKPEPSSTPRAPKTKSVSGAPKVVERKLKKMEQNKSAATRYRQKKRVEQDLLNTEREELERKNDELRDKAESISREITYLKDLMEEVRKRQRGKTASVV